MQESFDWLQPSPLWASGPARARQPGFFRPQILEFSDDDFIGAAMRVAAAPDPSGFRTAVAAQNGGAPLKLYQPAHGRYYLVAAALSCRIPGFPERAISAADGEGVSFVLRRTVGGDEFGWVNQGGAKAWQSLDGNPRRLLAGEDQLTLSPMPAADGRAVYAGYIPVASRESYAVSADTLTAALSDDDKKALKKNSIDPRIEEFEAIFVTPRSNAELVTPSSPSEPPPDDVWVYMLLNVWEFFATYLPDVAMALRGGPDAPTLSVPAADLMNVIAGQHLASGRNLAAALGDVARQADELDQVGDAGVASLGFDASYDVRGAGIDDASLEAAVAAALPAVSPPVQLPKQGGSDTYVIRCVYARPQCANPIAAVSLPSVPFRLANFFEADAPARPVRIVLPTDVSLGAMRKFNKGVTFIISDGLQKKINRLTGNERKILSDSPKLGDENGGLAWMCSFSIQIIFIVAFFLLLMFVIILNIAFWWIAFFRICLPLPKKLLPG